MVQDRAKYLIGIIQRFRHYRIKRAPEIVEPPSVFYFGDFLNRFLRLATLRNWQLTECGREYVWPNRDYSLVKLLSITQRR